MKTAAQGFFLLMEGKGDTGHSSKAVVVGIAIGALGILALLAIVGLVVVYTGA